MKLKEIVPRKLKLGDHVFYTHRASSSDGRDLNYAPWRHPLRDEWARPRRFLRAWNGKTTEIALDRWVTVWPESGYGVVVGLTSRYEGTITPSTDEQGFLSEFERYPLYVVKSVLRERGKLIPPWACFPLSWINESYDTSGIIEDWPVPKDGGEFSEYVDEFLRSPAEKVTSRA